jgi:ferrochelatase
MAGVAVLLMAHGTPDSLDQMPEYLMRVRNGRPASPQLIEEIRANCAAIGGRSPLTDLTRRQADALQAMLGPDVRVLVGMRNWHPFIADVVRDLDASTVGRIVGIPLAPQFSTLSVQQYVEGARAAIPEGIDFDCISSFHDHPLLVEAFAERLREAAPAEDEEIVFTAHSVPVRVVESGDPYADQVAATAAGVAARAGIATFGRAYQSAGRTPEPWLGPDLTDLIRQRAADGVRRFLIAPIGFVCDHTEILFDIDIQAGRIARECGATLRRTESLNASPAFIRLLAALVGDAIAGRPALSDPLRSTGAPRHEGRPGDGPGDPAGAGHTESKGSVPAEPSAAQHRTWIQNSSM